MSLKAEDINIAVIGLGYVGLPLALAFSEKYSVTGFDTSTLRIKELQNGEDGTLQVNSSELKNSTLNFSFNTDDIASCNVYIITVPTPVDESKKPDLTPLLQASVNIGKVLKQGDVC